MDILRELLFFFGDLNIEKNKRRWAKKPMPQHKGEWINIGRDPVTGQDEWEYKEPLPLKKIWVNIVEYDKGGYIITKNYSTLLGAVESFDCLNDNEANNAIELFEIYYKGFGNVTVDREIRECIQ